MQAVNHLAHNNHESCANFMSRWNVFATIECPLCGAKERTSHKFLLKVTVNSREVIDLVRELAQGCDDAAIVGILNRLGTEQETKTRGMKSVCNMCAIATAFLHVRQRNNGIG